MRALDALRCQYVEIGNCVSICVAMQRFLLAGRTNRYRYRGRVVGLAQKVFYSSTYAGYSCSFFHAISPARGGRLPRARSGSGIAERPFPVSRPDCVELPSTNRLFKVSDIKDDDAKTAVTKNENASKSSGKNRGSPKWRGAAMPKHHIDIVAQSACVLPLPGSGHAPCLNPLAQRVGALHQIAVLPVLVHHVGACVYALFSRPNQYPIWMSTSRCMPRQMTLLPGGGSLARAR